MVLCDVYLIIVSPVKEAEYRYPLFHASLNYAFSEECDVKHSVPVLYFAHLSFINMNERF